MKFTFLSLLYCSKWLKVRFLNSWISICSDLVIKCEYKANFKKHVVLLGLFCCVWMLSNSFSPPFHHQPNSDELRVPDSINTKFPPTEHLISQLVSRFPHFSKEFLVFNFTMVIWLCCKLLGFYIIQPRRLHTWTWVVWGATFNISYGIFFLAVWFLHNLGRVYSGI